jgi:hypothetical protein
MKLERLETPGIAHFSYLLADLDDTALVMPAWSWFGLQQCYGRAAAQ